MNHGMTEAPLTHISLPAPTVTVTQTVTERVPDPTLPAPCKKAIEIMLQAQPDLATLMTAGTSEQDILEEARIAIATRNSAGLTKAGDDQNNLNNQVSSSRRSLNGKLTELQSAMDDCDKTLGGG
jgi:hypothetical protein